MGAFENFQRAQDDRRRQYEQEQKFSDVPNPKKGMRITLPGKSQGIETETVALVSTAHITEDDCITLLSWSRSSQCPLVVYDTESGMLVHIAEKETREGDFATAAESLSDNCMQIINDLAGLGFHQWVWFHGDGPIYSDYPEVRE